MGMARLSKSTASDGEGVMSEKNEQRNGGQNKVARDQFKTSIRSRLSSQLMIARKLNRKFQTSEKSKPAQRDANPDGEPENAPDPDQFTAHR
jgi:hypothetical protein